MPVAGSGERRRERAPPVLEPVEPAQDRILPDEHLRHRRAIRPRQRGLLLVEQRQQRAQLVGLRAQHVDQRRPVAHRIPRAAAVAGSVSMAAAVASLSGW
jgi:hypothetical protein